MRNLALATLAVLAAVGCSDRTNREPATQDHANSPSPELVRTDTGFARPADSAAEPATTPVEETPPAVATPPPPRPRRHVVRATVEPKPTPPAYHEAAPDTLRDTVRVADTMQVPDTVRVADTVRVSDTVRVADTASAADTVAFGDTAAAPDTVSEVEQPRAAATSNPSVSSTHTLPVGTEIHAALDDSINSRRDSAGKSITAEVMQAVSDAGGAVVIPAGSRVRLTVTSLAPAGSRSAADGQLAFRVDEITIGDSVVPVKARVGQIPHRLEGRGVTGSEAAKVGAGAAAGAVAGRVLGGDAKGAVIGGVVGAAGGAAVATQTAKRDVVVAARTPVSFVLDAPLVAAAVQPSSP
ncbi:MAG TPA: hypothetical protein VFJ92_04635 [Gemmatimonadales bacterium]|nr:hypothetical protein [Gemmatimonadales bacterium]